jgi:TonB family protein
MNKVSGSIAVLLLLAVFSQLAYAQEVTPLLLLSELQLRERVLKVVTPEYPAEAKEDRAQGLVIVAVQFDAEGNLFKDRVVESPHPAITRAVEQALAQWKIKPVTLLSGVVGRTQGELRFIYEIKDGEGQVSEPSREVQRKLSKQYKAVEQAFRKSG